MFLVGYVAFYGSADVEESANSAFSAGIWSHSPNSTRGLSGTHDLFGVPIYDTVQGTGDRLPYQAAWGQSITWPLRFVIGWEYYALLRTLFFAIPAIYIGMTVLKSWLPRASLRTLFFTALLTNSSLGIYMRWNDWSDHYVQTLGVCAVCFLLMHKWFHDESNETTPPSALMSVLCLFIGSNGVLTGHPGFWPIAAVVPTAIGLSFLSSRIFRRRLARLIIAERRLFLLGSAAHLLTFGVIVLDLFRELQGEVWGERRLSRTQGLFSEFAFQGVFGLRPDGFLPEPIRRAVSVLLASTVLPVFVLLDSWLPRIARVSDYAELTRLEFGGLLIFLCLLRPFFSKLEPSLQAVTVRLACSQVAIWLYVILATLDLLPTALAPSGAWLVIPILLAINGLLSVIIFKSTRSSARLQRSLAGGNLAIIAVWCLFQFGALSLGTGFQTPEKIPTWFTDRDEIVTSTGFAAGDSASTRVMLAASLERRPLMNLISLGVPVVSPADPKIRTQNHLVDGFAFNYSIDPPSLWKMYDDYADRLLDFLQITDLVIQRQVEGQFMYSHVSDLWDRYPEQSVVKLPNRSENGEVENEEVQVLRRHEFSAFVLQRSIASEVEPCPHLKQTCELLAKSTKLDTTSHPKLRRCTEKCLWQFDAPTVRADNVLLLPITYDDSLSAQIESGEQIETMDVGGFLAVSSGNGFNANRLSIRLNPDQIMFARVSVSYLNLLTFLTLVVALEVRRRSLLHSNRRDLIRGREEIR
jgi:hypothetical protein